MSYLSSDVSARKEDDANADNTDMSSLSTDVPFERKQENDRWVLAGTLQPLESGQQQDNVPSDADAETLDTVAAEFWSSVIASDFSVLDSAVPLDDAEKEDATIVPHFTGSSDQITADFSGSSSSSSSWVTDMSTLSKEISIEESEDSSWSFSLMRFTGVTLFMSMVLSYIYVLWLARRHRFKIANGEALSIEMMYLKIKEQEATAMKREAAAAVASTGDRLCYKRFKAPYERSSFIKRVSYRWRSPFPAISEQQETSMNLSSMLSFSQHLTDKAGTQKDDEEQEEPSNNENASMAVQSDPWTCQFDKFSSLVRSSPTNDTVDNVDDKEVSTNSSSAPNHTNTCQAEMTTQTLPSLVAFSTPSSRKIALLKNVYVPSKHNQDILVSPLLPPRNEEALSKGMSCRSIFPVVPIPTSSKTRLASSSSKESWNVEPGQDLSPAVTNVSTTITSSSTSEDEENAEPCRLDDIFRATPGTTTTTSTRAASARRLLVPTEVESQVVIFRHPEDASAIYVQPPTKQRSMPPLCSAPPDHVL